jgi:hypothetical protein
MTCRLHGLDICVFKAVYFTFSLWQNAAHSLKQNKVFISLINKTVHSLKNCSRDNFLVYDITKRISLQHVEQNESSVVSALAISAQSSSSAAYRRGRFYCLFMRTPL